MKKILRFAGTITALILSLFGITACFDYGMVALYGVPSYIEDDEYNTNNENVENSENTLQNLENINNSGDKNVNSDNL